MCRARSHHTAAVRYWPLQGPPITPCAGLTTRLTVAGIFDSQWETVVQFQARACNTLASRALARWATHRHRVRRPAPRPRARTGVRKATLPWRGGRGAGKGVLPPPPQRRHPAGVAQRPREGQSPCLAAHLRAAGGAADTAHGRAGGIDRRAMGRLQPHR